MQKSRILTVFVLGIMLAGNALASTYEIEFTQYGDNVIERHIISLDEVEELEISLPESYTSLEVLNNYTLVDNKITVKGDYIEFSFVNPEAIDIGRNYYFNKKIAPGIALNSLLVTLKLDEGFVVSKQVYPEANTITSDGRRIIIEWIFNNLKEEDSVSLFVVFENIKGRNYLWAILILVVLGIGAWLLYPKIREKISAAKVKKLEKKAVKKKIDITEHLLENEKKVVDELRKENGLWQKQIQIKTGLSKVKLSRVLKNLEKRGFIRKENFGKTNKIYLKR